MHKLYSLSYAIIEGKEKDYFWDNFLFTEEEKPIVDYTYNSFDGFYNAVVSNSLPVMIGYGKTIILHEPYVRIDGIHFNRIITKRDFVNPTSIRVEYHECSPKYYSYDFFKKKLSMDDFMTFIKEHYKESEQYLIHD